MTLGVDIGGTNLCLGLIEEGQVLRTKSTPSFPYDAGLDQTLDYLSDRIRDIITESTEKIGIGVPSVLDAEKGIVFDAMNIPSWKEVHLKDFLEDRFHVPVAINNDANCFAMGAYGLYPEKSKPGILVGITLGTGLGIGIVEQGKMFLGDNCGAGEIGCIPRGNTILEDLCSKKYFSRYKIDPFEAAKSALSGDPVAITLFERFGRNLGEMLAIVLYAYDPSHIVFGGGIAKSFSLFEPSMRAYLRERYYYQKALENIKIESVTDGDVILLGASLI